MDRLAELVQEAIKYMRDDLTTYGELYPLGDVYLECDGRDSLIDTIKRIGTEISRGSYMMDGLLFTKGKTGYEVRVKVPFKSLDHVDSIQVVLPIYLDLLESMAKEGHKWKLIAEVY